MSHRMEVIVAVGIAWVGGFCTAMACANAIHEYPGTPLMMVVAGMMTGFAALKAYWLIGSAKATEP